MNNFYCSFVSIHYIICECGDTFPTEEALQEHLDNEHKSLTFDRNEYQCSTCGKIFATEKACLMHQQVHNKRVKVKREPRDPTQPKKRYYTCKNIVCEVCGKRYASNAALRYHQRVHTGERPYQCSMCPKTFTMPLFLQIHVRTHTGERPYQCQMCPKAFSNKAALLRHDRVNKSSNKKTERPDSWNLPPPKTLTFQRRNPVHINHHHQPLFGSLLSSSLLSTTLAQCGLADFTHAEN